MGNTRIRAILLALVVLLVVAQWVGPERSNPPIAQAESLEASAVVPSPVVATVRRACFDCHSHETQWPAYAYVAPVSWLVINHVNEGREQLNFSRWGGYSPDERAELLEDACKLARSGDMPLSSYLLIHREARPTGEEVEALCAWSSAETLRRETGR